MLFSEWSTAVFINLVIVVHESLVCSEQFNCLLWILQLTLTLWFYSIFMYLNPFQRWLYDFEMNLFTPRTTEGLIHNYYRRFKHSLMLQKEKPCIKSGAWKLLNIMEMCIFFSFCLNIYFHLVLPFRSYLHVFQKTNKVKFTPVFKFKKFYNNQHFADSASSMLTFDFNLYV